MHYIRGLQSKVCSFAKEGIPCIRSHDTLAQLDRGATRVVTFLAGGGFIQIFFYNPGPFSFYFTLTSRFPTAEIFYLYCLDPLLSQALLSSLFYFERVEIFSSPGRTNRNSLRGISLPNKNNSSRATLVIRTCLASANVVVLVVQCKCQISTGIK